MELYSTAGVDLAVLWPHIGHYVDEFCDRSRGEITPETLRHSVEMGESQLWVILDPEKKRKPDQFRAVLATQLAHTMSGMKVCTIIMCAGRARKEWVHLIYRLADWARSEGCERFKISARRGWVRDLTMFKVVGNDMEWNLTDGWQDRNNNA